jgi:hypothetical protein
MDNTNTDKILKKDLPVGDVMNTAVITFGRFQPPHLGHKKMMDYVYRLSKKEVKPEEVEPSYTDVSGKLIEDTTGKIIVAKRFILERKEEIKRSDPAPSQTSIIQELKLSGGYDGDSYVFVSIKQTVPEEKAKIYNPSSKSRSKKMTYSQVIELLNTPGDKQDVKIQKEIERIKTILSNPIGPLDKLKLMKLQYYNYDGLKIVDPTYFFEEDDELYENKNIQLGDIVPKLLKNNYNRIVIVIGADRQNSFDFVAKSSQEFIPEGMEKVELIIIAVGRDIGGTGLISSLSATKVRKSLLNIDIDNYDDPKNNDEKDRLHSYLTPQDAPQNVKDGISELLPSLIKKVQEGYKPDKNMSGGKKKKTHKRRIIMKYKSNKTTHKKFK